MREEWRERPGADRWLFLITRHRCACCYQLLEDRRCKRIIDSHPRGCGQRIASALQRKCKSEIQSPCILDIKRATVIASRAGVDKLDPLVVSGQAEIDRP